jgi:hypothetical protein
MLSGDETEFADELPRGEHDDELLGLIISNNLDLPIDEHEEVRIRLAGTVKHVSRCQFASFAELAQLFQGVWREDGKPPIQRVGHNNRDLLAVSHSTVPMAQISYAINAPYRDLPYG